MQSALAQEITPVPGRPEVGQRFGRLVVYAVVRKWLTKRRHLFALAVCDCGRHVAALAPQVIKGKQRSCGCIRSESSATATHRKTKTPTFKVWAAMRQRCGNPNNAQYKDYGGRGIDICERWSTFDAFLADMGEKPEGLSIERVDVNGPYSPENCIWADRKAQSRNKRTSHLVSFQGETKCIADWADDFSVPHRRLGNHIRKGLSLDKAVALAQNPRPRRSK